ncbi:MAG TPA: PASTA domain-containing protein [Bdellovibrionota bacterium]|nr:PASTA domain-containing protein [Bdellovibrionota bacterium]
MVVGDTQRRWPAWVGYIGLFLAVFVLSVTWTIHFLVRSKEEVRVPNLIGKTLSEAKHLLAQEQISLEVLGLHYSDQIAGGSVLQQNVPPNEQVRAGRTVGVYVSQGPRTRNAPRVIGLSIDAATAILRSAGLQAVTSAFACSESFPFGNIVAQDPAPGSAMIQNEVYVLSSSGPCNSRFIMANLAGSTLDAALRALDRAGLAVRSFRYDEREDLPERTVSGVEPQPGAVVRLFDPIVLSVSAAPKSRPAATEEPRSRIVYLPIESPPGLTRHEAQLQLERGDAISSYTFDFLLGPGENPGFVVWMPDGAEAVWILDGQESWRKTF